MKTKVFYLASKVTVAVVLVAILALKALAGEAPKVKMVPHSSERAVVVVDNAVNTISELAIEDSKGDVLYYREGRIDEKVYSKIFDFKNLSDGDYKIIVSNDFGKKEVRFTVADNTIEVIKDVKSEVPYFSVEDDVLKLSFLNHSLKNIDIVISDAYGEVFKKSLGNNFNITTGFDLAKLSAGGYAAIISDGKNTYHYTFEK
ncbi:hypothetical protein [Roseimarinus sediminis]|uniref:hypothetical protein n=1 Tax=Roseimarinus sediminis TaxID=1610899 RepID=UPI003D1C28EB